MRRIVLLAAMVVSCSHNGGRLGFVPQTSPGLSWITWGTATATCNSRPCVLLDGGAATFTSDPITAGGLSGVSESGATIFCSSPYFAPIEDYVTAEIGNDGTLFVSAPTPNSALIDGGYGDSGVAGTILIATGSPNYYALALTHLAAQTFDGGYLDAGFFNDGGFYIFPDGGYNNIVDGGSTFCDGGSANFCDGGAITYDGGPIDYGLMYQAIAAVSLSCNINTVPR
jgi:hypothetical protein